MKLLSAAFCRPYARVVVERKSYVAVSNTLPLLGGESRSETDWQSRQRLETVDTSNVREERISLPADASSLCLPGRMIHRN